MNEIAVREAAGIATTGPDATFPQPAGAMRLVEWAAEAQAAHRLASALVRTPFAGSWKGDIDGATAAILKGAEVGLTPVTALGAFDNIQGTPAPKAITLRALVQSHGHDLEIIEENDQRAVARYRRNGKGDWITTEFTIEQARQMNLLGKDNWKKQPGNMLVARVTSKAARLVASDVILGIGYSAEEVRDSDEWQQPQQRPAAPRGSASDRMRQMLNQTSDAGVNAGTEATQSTAQQVVDSGAPLLATVPEVASDEAKDQATPRVSPAPASDSPLLNTSSALAKALFAAMGEKGIKDKAARLRLCSEIAGRDITSSSELTEQDARDILDYLPAVADVTDAELVES